MRLIAFITFSTAIHKMLNHIGVDPEAPRIAVARGPLLWEGVEALPHCDLASPSPPDCPADHRTTW